MSTTLFSLKVKKVVKETSDAVAIYFDIPSSLKETFQFRAGQYLTLELEINNQKLRRAYSICTAPYEEGQVAVAVKKVKDGRVSTYLNDKLREGDVIQVLPPEGKFVVNLDADKETAYYMFAGGSGITPMMSLLKTIIEDEPKSSCSLFYGNSDEDHIIFKNELEAIEQKYAGQVEIRHILDNPKKTKTSGLSGLFKKATTDWTGWTGFMDKDKIQKFIHESKRTSPKKKYLICGPAKMMELVVNSLKELGIAEEDILIEYFTSPDDGKKNTVDGTVGEVIVHLNGQRIELNVPLDKTILDALIDAKYDPPYSCTSGACSTCVAQIIKGSAEMEMCYALDKKEIEKGFLLTCQAHPTSEYLEIKFDH